jgi:pimeloyl-ACP methyl ester carboxylesterase
VPRVNRPDGAEIEFRLEGDQGPLVAIARTAFHPPAVCKGIVEELAPDYRVLTYDLRGTGASSRAGPYDIETDTGDLAAVLEQAGGDALAIGLGDGSRRVVRVAADRPDLIHTVVVSGELPLGPIADTGQREALADSRVVLDTLLGLLETDYRTGLRSMLTSGEDWERAELRARLDEIESHCPREAGIERLRAWTRDDSLEYARALGDRLWYLHYPGNSWFQGSLEAIRRGLPDARFEAVPDGVISRPRENATVIRGILAGRRTAAP